MNEYIWTDQYGFEGKRQEKGLARVKKDVMLLINRINTYCFEVVGIDYVIDDMLEVRDAINAAWLTGYAVAYIRDLEGFVRTWKDCPTTLLFVLNEERVSEIDFSVDIDAANRLVLNQVQDSGDGVLHESRLWKVKLAKRAQI